MPRTPESVRQSCGIAWLGASNKSSLMSMGATCINLISLVISDHI